MWIDNDFPKLLGAELYRPHPAYIIEMAVEPVVVHDFSKQPGQTVQLDRYRFWGKPGTKESRERTADQTLGSASARNIVKDKVLVTLREYTGPADSRDATQPSTFKVARETLITAQRLLLDTGNLNVFHQSIGSLTLLSLPSLMSRPTFSKLLRTCVSATSRPSPMVTTAVSLTPRQ